MTIRRDGPVNPTGGMITTSMGLRAPRPALCEGISGGHRPTGVVLVRNPNGKMVCPLHGGENLIKVIDEGLDGAASA